MSKHTPGPWFQKNASITSANGWPIAFASYPERMPDTNEEREPGESWLDASNRLKTERDRIESKMEANARLIAAAPELLEAAKLVIAWYEAEDDHSKADLYQRLQMCRDSEAALRAAIAKATGEAQ